MARTGRQGDELDSFFGASTGFRDPSLVCASARSRGFWQRHAKGIAAALLALLCLRFAWALGHGGLTTHAIASITAAVALGGCLWWVAQRQVGGEAAALVLALYVSTPAVLAAQAAIIPALGLFAMLYTGVGVAHALAGPRHKWPGRIGLMTGLCAFTGWAQPLACAAGLVLSLAAMVWLMERERRWLVLLFALWTAAALAGFLGSRAWLPHALFHAENAPGLSALPRYAGIVFALAGALLIWARHKRSRYFGHSAPLLAALLLAGLFAWCGWGVPGWALPFALLFMAGAWDDGIGSKQAGLWRTFGWSAVAMQIAGSLLSP